MKQYTKTIGGKSVIKTRSQIVVTKDGRTTINPTEEMILADGWVEYVAPQEPIVTPPVQEDVEPQEPITPQEPTEIPEELSAKAALVRARHRKRNDILRYDKSSEVERFYINDIPLWLDREERATLQRRFEIEQKKGITNSTLWKNGIEFPLVIAEAMLMLDDLEMYAIQSFDCTQRHYAVVNSFTSVEEIEAYDHTVGYPDKLRF